MMIGWWEHSQKGVTDGQTDGRTDWTIHRAAWSQLKMQHFVHQINELNIFEEFIKSLRITLIMWHGHSKIMQQALPAAGFTPS